METETKAILRGVRISAQKMRLVANQIRGKSVDEALLYLKFSPKKAAFILSKTLKSAMSNAEHNDGMDIDDCKVGAILVDKAASLKRSTQRAKGRGARIEKQACHITVTVRRK